MSRARSGLRLDIGFLRKFIPVSFTAALGEDAYAVLALSGSYSLIQSKVVLQDAIEKNWSLMLAPCRQELARPNVSVLTEVYFAAKGSSLQFFRGDGQELKLSLKDGQSVAQAMVAAGSVRGDGGDIVFDFDLPIMYSVIRPSVVMGCPFSLKSAGNEEYRECVRRLAAPERGLLLTEASAALRRDFADVVRQPKPAVTPEDFKTTNGIIDFLYAFDRDNGHALYYEGTVRRWIYRADRQSDEFLRSHMPFRRYLQISDTMLPDEKDGTAEACYARARGYCAERMAWILHQMANDMYQVGLKETRPNRKRQHFEEALRHANGCLKVRQKGFDQAIATLLLKKLLEEQLEHLKERG